MVRASVNPSCSCCGSYMAVVGSSGRVLAQEHLSLWLRHPNFQIRRNRNRSVHKISLSISLSLSARRPLTIFLSYAIHLLLQDSPHMFRFHCHLFPTERTFNRWTCIKRSDSWPTSDKTVVEQNSTYKMM